VREVQTANFAKRVLDPGHCEIERMVVRQRDQVEPERLERVERLRRRQEPAVGVRSLLTDGRFVVREDGVALQERRERRHDVRRVDPDVGANHRLPGEHECDRLRLPFR
jgi:hypothetical protein